MISLFAFSSCIREIRDSINKEKQQNENLATERINSEMAVISDDALVIYKPNQEIKINPKFKNLGNSESIKEAYNKPGKVINFAENYSLDYSPNSLWTKYNHSKEITRVYYNKSENESESGFIFLADKIETKEVLDIIPLLIFLALLGVMIYSIFCKSEIYLFLVFWLIILNGGLVYNCLIKLGDLSYFLCFLLSLITTVIIFAVFSLLAGLIGFLGTKKIPMPKYKEKTASLVLSYSLVVSLVFIFFAKLPISYLSWAVLFFLSPYLFFWIITTSNYLRFRKLIKTMEKINNN